MNITRPKFQLWVPSLNTMYPHEMIDFNDLFNLQEEPKDFFLLQYIEQKDCNDLELYVGDIIKNGLSGTWIIQCLEQGAFSLLGICDQYKDSEFNISALNVNVEKIGSIFQPPKHLESIIKEYI